MGKGVPCIMDYQYDWIYEKEPDFMPAPLESQILLAYSTNDEIVRDMMSTFNVDMQESYNLTPVSTMLLTPETDRIFSMDDFRNGLPAGSTVSSIMPRIKSESRKQRAGYMYNKLYG